MKVVPWKDTDGDKALIVLDPRVIALRKRNRATYLANIKSPVISRPISMHTMREDALNSLKDAGVGKITNWYTTTRDIQLMTQSMPGPNGEQVLPENVQQDLLRLADIALKTLKASVLDGEDVTCCQQVASLAELKGILNNPSAYPIWSRRICTVAEWLMRLYRRMQEIAIASPKSGEWFDESKYRWAILKVRADWHKPHHKNVYNSWSPVGRLHAYVNLQWKELKEEAKKTQSRIQPLLSVDVAPYGDAYQAVKRLKGEFGATMYEIGKLKDRQAGYGEQDIEDVDDVIDDDEIRQMEKDTYELYANFMAQLVLDFHLPLTVAAALVYRASYDNGRNSENTEGFTFMWACFGEEIVAALRYLSTDPGMQLVRFKVRPELTGYFIQDGPVIVEEREVYVFDETQNVYYPLGTAAVDNGSYDLRNDKNGQPYLLVPKEKRALPIPELKIEGREFNIIGFRYRTLTFPGKDGTMKTLQLTKDHAIRMLDKSSGLCRAEVALGLNDMPTVYISTLVGTQWVRFGNIPNATSIKSDEGFWGQALLNKEFRVSMVKEIKASEGTLRVQLTKVLGEF